MNKIDLALSVLCAVSYRDESLTTYEIADVCGCSQTLISQILRNALKKLKVDGIELMDYLET